MYDRSHLLKEWILLSTVQWLYINTNKTNNALSVFFLTIDHFTVVCSVTWSLNGSKAGVDTDVTAFVVLIKLFLC